MAGSSGSKTSSNDIDNQIKQVREEVSELSKLILQFGEERVSEAGQTARAQAGQASEKLKAKAASIEDRIVEKPVQSAIIALLIGLVIGSLSRR